MPENEQNLQGGLSRLSRDQMREQVERRVVEEKAIRREYDYYVKGWCPLFGSIQYIKAIYNDEQDPALDECWDLFWDARNRLLSKTFPDLQTYIKHFHCKHPFKVPYPDSNSIEDRFGYPSKLIDVFRLIYINAEELLFPENYRNHYIDGDNTNEIHFIKHIENDVERNIEHYALELTGIPDVQLEIKISKSEIFFILAMKCAMGAILLRRGIECGWFNADQYYLRGSSYFIRASDMITQITPEQVEILRKKNVESKVKSIKKRERDKKEELFYKSMRKELIRIARVCVSKTVISVGNNEFMLNSATKLDKSKASYVKNTQKRIINYLAGAKVDNKLLSKKVRTIPEVCEKLFRLSEGSILQYIKEDKKQIWNSEV
jgi:hypothetical protein